MPIAITFGGPNSGKTAAAGRLAALYSARTGLPVHVVSPESLGFSPRQQIERAADLRRRLYQFSQQHVGAGSLTVVDYDNFIKSFRYELYCVARERGTRFCVLEAPKDSRPCEKWPENEYFNVMSRKEDILPTAEWDGPVFTAEGDACEFLCQEGVFAQKRAPRSAEDVSCDSAAFVALSCERMQASQRAAGCGAGVQLSPGIYAYLTRKLEASDFQQIRRDCARRLLPGHESSQLLSEMLRDFLIEEKLSK